jgi:hypothetical protein
MTGSKRVDHWASGTVYECSEIAGSPQYHEKTMLDIITEIKIYTIYITGWGDPSWTCFGPAAITVAGL